MAVLFLNNAAWADASLYKGRDKIGVVKSLNSNSKLYVSAQDVAAIFGFRSSYSNEELVLSNGRSQIRILMNSAAAWRDNSLISLNSVPFEQDGTCWLDTSSVTTLFQRMAGAGQQNKLRFAASSSSSYANNKQDIIINPQPVITPQANANNDNNIIRDNERITRPEPVILPPVNNDIIKDEERNKRPEPIILPPEDSSQIIIAPKPERKPEEFKSDSSTLINNPEELTENWFMSQKLCKRTNRGGLTPMNLSMIVDLMRDDPELIVMFDLWRMWDSKDTRDFSMCFSKLASEDIKKRCVIEVYNKNMLAGIRETESDLKVMYCVHGPQDPEFDENVSPDILKRLGINIISYPWLSAQEHPGELENYHNAGFIIFSLYKDNRYSKQMKSSGVNVNLVDNKYHIILLLLYWLKQRIRRGIMK